MNFSLTVSVVVTKWKWTRAWPLVLTSAENGQQQREEQKHPGHGARQPPHLILSVEARAGGRQLCALVPWLTTE